MRYLVVVLLLSGCATQEMAQRASNENLCTPYWEMTDENYRIGAVERERRNIVCREVGNPYPAGAIVVIPQ